MINDLDEYEFNVIMLDEVKLVLESLGDWVVTDWKANSITSWNTFLISTRKLEKVAIITFYDDGTLDAIDINYQIFFRGYLSDPKCLDVLGARLKLVQW